MEVYKVCLVLYRVVSTRGCPCHIASKGARNRNLPWWFELGICYEMGSHPPCHRYSQQKVLEVLWMDAIHFYRNPGMIPLSVPTTVSHSFRVVRNGFGPSTVWVPLYNTSLQGSICHLSTWHIYLYIVSLMMVRFH